MKDGAGSAFIIMEPYVSRRMYSLQPSALGFPPEAFAFLKPARPPKDFQPRGASAES